MGKRLLQRPRTCSNIVRKCSKSEYARTCLILLTSSILCYLLLFSPLKRAYATNGQQIENTAHSQQEQHRESPYKRHMEAVQIGCGDVCKIDMVGSPSLFHDYIEKEVDCRSLLSNSAIDATMVEANPPKTIPDEMLDAFTYNGQVPLRPWSDRLLNQRYLGKEVS